MENLSKVIQALGDLEQSSNYALKYGPYFFAVALLTVAPFVARAMLGGWLTNIDDPKLRNKIYEDFRYYFRKVITAGIACVAVGVMFWVFMSYRDDRHTANTVADLQSQLEKLAAIMKTMNYTAFGVIGPGVKAQDVFYETHLTDQLSIVFAKLPSPLPQSEASWLFVVLSNNELPQPLNFSIAWSQVGPNNEAPTALTLMPVRLTAAKEYTVYKFSLEGDFATIRPVNSTN